MLTPNTLIHNRYQIVRLLGKGGMGAVYEAIDRRLSSRVALKQTLVGGEQLDRAFEREAKLLANLRHPALPKVLDYFSDAKGQMLVMEYIPGEDLATLLARRGGPFPVDEVLRWADAILDALDYLHRLAPPVIHRDIKPQNLKLTDSGQIILLDFGLAKGAVALQPQLTSGTIVHGYTPYYASPEQIQPSGTDARSDLYSLAATLYHLLTDTMPADARERDKARSFHQPDPLQAAHQIEASVPTTLGALLLNAMALDPDNRVISAKAMRAALQQVRMQQVPTVVDTLPPTLPVAPDAGAARSAVITPATASLVRQLACWDQRADVRAVACSPDGQTLAVGLSDRTVRLLRVPGGSLAHTLEHTGRVMSVAWSPDGQFLASGAGYKDEKVRLWRVRDGVPTRVLEQSGYPLSIMFAPNGQLLAVGSSDRNVRLWRVHDGALLLVLREHQDVVWNVAFAPDGQTIASSSADGTVRLWRLGDGTLSRMLGDGRTDVWSIAFTPDGQTIASGWGDGTIRLYSAGDGALVRALTGHGGHVYTLAVAPDGQTIATGSHDRTIRLWRIHDGALLHTLEGHEDEVRGVTFALDGRALASGSADGTIRTWGIQM